MRTAILIRQRCIDEKCPCDNKEWQDYLLVREGTFEENLGMLAVGAGAVVSRTGKNPSDFMSVKMMFQEDVVKDFDGLIEDLYGHNKIRVDDIDIIRGSNESV